MLSNFVTIRLKLCRGYRLFQTHHLINMVKLWYWPHYIRTFFAPICTFASSSSGISIFVLWLRCLEILHSHTVSSCITNSCNISERLNTISCIHDHPSSFAVFLTLLVFLIRRPTSELSQGQSGSSNVLSGSGNFQSSSLTGDALLCGLLCHFVVIVNHTFFTKEAFCLNDSLVSSMNQMNMFLLKCFGQHQSRSFKNGIKWD